MFYLAMITASNQEEAETITKALLKKKLIACSNIVPAIQSMYWWKGKIEKETEVLLMVKTHSQVWDDLVKEVKRHHSYDVPEIIATPIETMNQDYRDWLSKELDL